MTQTYLSAAVLVLLVGCLASPQREQMGRLHEQLVGARAALGEERVEAGCNDVGDVQSKLWGEPGLSEVQPAWGELRAASDALVAACGQTRLLQQAYEDTPAMVEARERWRVGLAHELTTACQHLSEAARALNLTRTC